MEIKMAEYKDTESPYEHIKNTSICGAIHNTENKREWQEDSYTTTMAIKKDPQRCEVGIKEK